MNFQQPPGPPPLTDPEQILAPALPALRTFVVQRYHPATEEIETITIHAHVVQHTTTGALVFNEYVIDPIEGPTQRSRQGIAQWIDFKEVVVEAASSLILH